MTRHDDRRGIDETIRAARTVRSALIACALVTGCDEPEPAAVAEATTTIREGAPPVCPAGRVITMSTDPTCADVVGTKGTWLGEPLFVQESDGLPVEGQLRRYCEFTWSDPDTQPELWRLQGGPHSGAASDCEVIWPQGDILSDGLAAPLRDLFYAQLRRPTALPATLPTPVRIALPDTASIATGVEMRSKHARNMAGIIHAAACPLVGPCVRKIERNLAMPRVEGGAIEPMTGGFYGSQGDLARAIRTAVDRWQVAPGSAKLVINLSLGWETGPFGGGELPPNMKANVRAVYDALQLAVCRGALVVTAAGNAAGDACVEDGPLAPALWERHRGPSVAACGALFGTSSKPVPGDIATRPLVHAVGGVDHGDGPLQNVRPGGRPRLAAPAFMSVADDPAGLTTALTGSSVAAAAVSGAAALVWSYFPGLTPGALMDRLHAHGVKVEDAADFGVGGAIRRLNVCRALAGTSTGCPEPALKLETLRAAADELLAELDDADLIDVAPQFSLPDLDKCPMRCEMVELYSRADATPACADNRVGATTRYTEPQPEWPDCPVCFISKSDGVLHMTLGEQHSLSTWVQALLVSSDGVNDAQHSALGAFMMSNQRATDVVLPDEALKTALEQVTLHLTFPDGRVSSGTVLVL